MPESDGLRPIEPTPVETSLVRTRPELVLDAEGPAISSYLRSYWHVLVKRKWSIFAITFVITTLAAVFAFKTHPIYRATSRVAVEPENPVFQIVQNLGQIQPTNGTFLQTQVDVLDSENLAWKTIEELKLDTNPEFSQVPSENSHSAASTAATEARLIQVFRQALSVRLLDGTRIIEVSFESPDPGLAARVVNALVNNYTEYNFLTKYDATRQASAWMEQRLDEMKAKVEHSQQALVDYQRKHSIIDIGNRQSVMEQRLSNLSQDLTDAQNTLAQKESVYRLAQANPQQVGLLTPDALLQQLGEKYGELRTQYVNVLAQYGPKFPSVVRLHDQLKEVQSLMDQQRKQTFDQIQHDYQAALGREQIISAEVDQEKAAIGKANQLLIQQNILQHEFETNQTLYDSLLTHVKNATVSAGMRANNVHVIDHALLPTAPVRPRKARTIAVGFVIGLMLGITVAFVQEGLDSSVKNAEDIERFVPAPALAVIPLAESTGPSHSWLLGGRRMQAEESIALAALKTPSSPLAESYRTLRTSILLSTAPRPPRTILVTSSLAGEGKTCTSLNLALSLAQRGDRVLVVDADLRKPGISGALGLNGKAGLSGILTGANTLDETLVQVETASNLWALTAGRQPPNPAELLSSPTMEQVLRDLGGRFDFVVLDSPPLLAVTDSTVLSTLVDGVVLVVENGVTPRNALVRSYRVLQSAGGRILGTVVNKMDLRHDGYYGYGYRRYYASYYGSQSSAKERSDQPPTGIIHS